MSGHEKALEKAAAELKEEVEARCEWYGLDNWAFDEVAEFVVSAYLAALCEGLPEHAVKAAQFAYLERAMVEPSALDDAVRAFLVALREKP